MFENLQYTSTTAGSEWEADSNERFCSPKTAERVAEAVLYCAEHPQRDVFVGAGGKALSIAGKYAPRLTDNVMEATLFDIKITSQAQPKNLHQCNRIEFWHLNLNRRKKLWKAKQNYSGTRRIRF